MAAVAGIPPLPLSDKGAEELMLPRVGDLYLGHCMEDQASEVLEKRAQGRIGESLLINLADSDEADINNPEGDPARAGGTHWTCACLVRASTGIRVQYFDSFGGGVGIDTKPQLEMWGRQEGKPYPVDDNRGRTHQHPKSITCGLFCVVVMCLLGKGVPPKDVLTKFLRDGKVDRNEWVISEMLKT